MKLSEELCSESILVRYPPKSKSEVIHDLVHVLCEKHHTLNREEVLSVVLAREEQVSTGVGCGLAVPHGKIKEIEKIYMAAAVCPEGIDFKSQDCEPAKLLFLIISPESSAGIHIKALSCISRLISDAQVRKQLVDSDNSEHFLEVIKEAEESL